MRKKLIATLIAFLAIVPAFAVLNEKDLAQTLAVLRQELQMAKAEMQKSQVFISANTKATHERLVRLIQKTNELSLMLYSQKQDYTFDLTYALDEVTKEYKAFSNVRVPFDAIVTQMEIEIERYEKLIATLGKSEDYLMVGIEDSYDLWFGGRKLEKGAYVAVSLLGDAPKEKYEKLTGEICDLMAAELDIPGDAVYVTYHPVSNWGWNGNNF